MTATEIFGCSAEGCPVVETGRCLEGFDPPSECPHISLTPPDAEAQASSEEDGVPLEDEDAVGEEEISKLDEPTVELGGGESLTIPLADQTATRYGAQVVLIAGDFQSGKTTLLAELYGRFLKGPYEGWSFAGSDCIRALDARYHGTRESSGLAHPDVPRTEDEEMRLVDLRVERAGTRVPLMLSDIRGELFDSIVEGAPVEEAVPLAARADKLVILVDGEKVADSFQRAGVASWYMQLIGGLTEPGGVPPGTRTAVVLSKADLVEEENSQWFTAEAQKMRALAAARGLAASEIFSIAARPDLSPHEPLELPPLFEWLLAEESAKTMSSDSGRGQGRSFWRWTADD